MAPDAANRPSYHGRTHVIGVGSSQYIHSTSTYPSIHIHCYFFKTKNIWRVAILSCVMSSSLRRGPAANSRSAPIHSPCGPSSAPISTPFGDLGEQSPPRGATAGRCGGEPTRIGPPSLRTPPTRRPAAGSRTTWRAVGTGAHPPGRDATWQMGGPVWRRPFHAGPSGASISARRAQARLHS